MELRAVTRSVHEQLAATAAVGDETTQQAAQLLSVSLEPALRLALQEAVGQVAAEISAEIAPGRVELTLRGGELEVHVVPAPEAGAGETAPPPSPQPAAPEDQGEDAADGGSTRVTFRPPQQLKGRLEQAAAAEGLSLNSYLVRTLTSHLDARRTRESPRSRSHSGRTSGWFI